MTDDTRPPKKRNTASLAAEAAFRVTLDLRGATLLEPEWLGALKGHHIVCAEGHHGWPKPNNVAAGPRDLPGLRGH